VSWNRAIGGDHSSGRQFLQIPGPTNVPDRVLRAMDRAVIDHRGAELPEITHEVVANIKRVFATLDGRVALWAGSGTGAWEAAVVNTLNPGDRVLAFNNGTFAEMFAEVASKFGADVDLVDMRANTDELLRLSEERLNLSLGAGLGRLKGKVFRIGHLGSLNELEVLATLGGVELALDMAGERVELGSGVAAAQQWFAEDGW